MTKNRVYILTGISILFFFMVYSLLSPGPESEYKARLNQDRAEKNRAFRMDKQTPFSEEQIKSFMGLNYFPANSDFIVNASLEYEKVPDTLLMPFTDGGKDTLIRVGRLNFELEGSDYTLIAFRNPFSPDGKIFIPFKDHTSGIESYGGGRYLEATDMGGAVQLDFNRAYNPFCAYNENYVCVIPPPENMLSLRILAGEKNFASH